MTRIDETFARLRASGSKALIAYLCMGDPSEEESVELALACVDAGADILELGVPFSDPTADGARIARASQRAISRGGGLTSTLRAAAAIRKRSDVPLVLFGYYNPLFVRGDVAAAKAAQEAGIDALLVVDLPVDEAGPLWAEAHALGMTLVPLLAPTSSPPRIAAVKRAQQRFPGGFVYYVSVAGVTGNATAPLVAASLQAARLRAEIGAPVIVGFGVDSPEKAREASKDADGIAVGTAIVKIIEEGATPEARIQGVAALVARLRSAVDGADQP